MKRAILLLACCLTVAGRLSAEPTSAVQRVRLDGVAAVVNARVITVAEVMTLLEPERRRLARELQGDALAEQMAERFNETLNALIDRYVILDAYEKQEGRLPEWAIDERAETLIGELFGGDRSKLLSALAEEAMTYEAWRDGIRDHMIVQSMRSAHVDRHINVPPGAVRRYYEDNLDSFRQSALVKLRMLVVSPSGMADPEAKRAHAETLVKRLRGGEDFGLLARKESSGARAEVGGDWGWIDPERELAPVLAREVQKLKTGAISDPVSLAGNAYILHIEGRREAAVAPFESVQADIERQLRREAGQRVYDAWMHRLRADAFIKIMDVELS